MTLVCVSRDATAVVTVCVVMHRDTSLSRDGTAVMTVCVVTHRDTSLSRDGTAVVTVCVVTHRDTSLSRDGTAVVTVTLELNTGCSHWSRDSCVTLSVTGFTVSTSLLM